MGFNKNELVTTVMQLFVRTVDLPRGSTETRTRDKRVERACSYAHTKMFHHLYHHHINVNKKR